MSNIGTNSSRSEFFPRAKSAKSRGDSLDLRRNSNEKKKEIEFATKGDVKLDISSKVRDFARTKSAVDKVGDIDNSSKMAELKKKIQNGTYSIDYGFLADKILNSEF